jgi:hypothetical protein
MVFAGRHFQPEQTVLFIRGVLQGTPTAPLARERRISRTTAMEVRNELRAHAERSQPTTLLDDLAVETDEMLQNAGEKSTWHGQPADPPAAVPTNDVDAAPNLELLRKSGQS